MEQFEREQGGESDVEVGAIEEDLGGDGKVDSDPEDDTTRGVADDMVASSSGESRKQIQAASGPVHTHPVDSKLLDDFFFSLSLRVSSERQQKKQTGMLNKRFLPKV